MSGSSCAFEVLVDGCCVVLDARLGALAFVFDAEAGIGCSLARSNIVSAAMIPPIECPTSIVCTDGSTVGEGVPLFRAVREQYHTFGPKCTCFVTSRSMTLFSSHSRNLATQSFKSPRVSYRGYAIATMLTFGRAWLNSARRWSGKVPKVSSPPCGIHVRF